jgi:hypothetical protein
MRIRNRGDNSTFIQERGKIRDDTTNPNILSTDFAYWQLNNALDVRTEYEMGDKLNPFSNMIRRNLVP